MGHLLIDLVSDSKRNGPYRFFRSTFILGPKVSKSRKKYVVLDSPKKRTLGHFSVNKNAPAFVFLENLNIFFLRFTDF